MIVTVMPAEWLHHIWLSKLQTVFHMVYMVKLRWMKQLKKSHLSEELIKVHFIHTMVDTFTVQHTDLLSALYSLTWGTCQLITNMQENKLTEITNFGLQSFLWKNIIPYFCTLSSFLLTHSANYNYTYLLTPWSRVLLEKLTSCRS
jgi:hypothetical protein